jgi:hypothetical protein
MGIRHPPCSSSLTNAAQPSWRMPVPPHEAASPVVSLAPCRPRPPVEPVYRLPATPRTDSISLGES